MNRRIRSLIVPAVVALLLAAVPAARASLMDDLAKTTPQERAGIQTAFMKAKLGLSPEEAQKIEAINLKYAEKAEPVIKGDDGMFAKARQMGEIQSEKDAEMQTALSPQQYQAYQAAKDELKEKFEQAVAKKAAAAGGQ
ncbi:hypothetical protein K2Z84_21300 [Candidatus Binatia bacterium]|jgi:hypothetical protein|nr:hypothetical protein [Candidatus Binatia bacterium]